MTDQKSVFLKILGEFSLTASDRPISIPGRKKKALLAVVALAPNQRISRHRLKATLWSDRSTEQANNSLKTTLSELRRHIGQEIADSILQADRESVWLNMSEAQIDLTRLSKVAYSHSISDKLASLELCEAFPDIVLVQDPPISHGFDVHHRPVHPLLPRHHVLRIVPPRC